jgi:hypothetical protein
MVCSSPAEEIPQKLPMNKTGMIFFGGIVAVAALLIIVGVVASKKKGLDEGPRNYETMTSREVALICTTDMATEFHIHPMLRIIIDGKDQVIPADIGIVNGCMNAIHTHDATGKLHVESPVQKDFTLGDFFAVWKQPFDRAHVLDKVAEGGASIRMTVNGALVDTYENTILRDEDQIVIEYASKQ